jgi:hypothetical protein
MTIKPRPGKAPKRVPESTNTLPATVESAGNLPSSAPDGTIMINASKYARNAVLTAFEMIGGTEELANWGRDNKTDFYTKLFGKTIQKDIEVGSKDDIESLLDRVDPRQQKELEDEMTIDAEFEMVGDLYDGQIEPS